MVYCEQRKQSKRKKGRSEIEEAKETAFRFLSYRPRSIAEVTVKLTEKGFSPATITATLHRLGELGYLDDREYARTVARISLERKNWGMHRIQDALAKKGVAREIITLTLSELNEQYDLTEVARRAFASRFSHGKLRLFDERERRKAVTFLRRRGFDWGTIYSVINDRP